jgi:Caspase domain
MKHLLIAVIVWAAAQPAFAQVFRPPPFVGGVPGMSQMQAIQMQRQQSRTLLYREALEELRKNPRAADYAPCPPGAGADAVCVPTAAAEPLPADIKPAIRKRVALLIGNNAYVKPVPLLETPIADVERIAEILRARYGYETTVIKNASKAAIARALNQLAANVRPEDSVLVFYAGHGYLMNDINMGYWLPVDASEKTAANWISNEDISKFLTAIPARQLILVSDSCYSGTLTREFRVTGSGKVDAEDVLRKRSVLVLTSGGDEPVADEGKGGHSIFAWHLIGVLNAAQGLTPGANVFTEVRKRVSKDYPQTPQYGAAVSAGHTAGGEYLFTTAK